MVSWFCAILSEPRRTLPATGAALTTRPGKDEPMADDVLDFLREQFMRVNGRLDKIDFRLDEITARLGLLEHGYANLSARVDFMNQRLERIERRLDLVGSI
jgi:tetrahydromethanopterin S-methyltransferase subunit G